MTITLTVTTALLPKFEDKIIPTMGISISDFDVAPRTDYDRGDCDCIILLKQTSTVQTIPRIARDYYFIPDTTIRHLLANTSDYPIGTVAALVVAAKRSGAQYILEIKDGHEDSNKAQLWMNANFTQQYLDIEDKIQSNELPVMLFKNIVKRADLKNAFRIGIATFVCKLNDKRALQTLSALIESTTKVTGTLTIANAFSNPFISFCPTCKYKFGTFGMLHGDTARCTKCQQDVKYAYSLHLKSTLTTNSNQPIHCILERNTIVQLIPNLIHLSPQDYMNDKSKVIETLREFTVEGDFTLNQSNIIVHCSPTKH